MRVVVDIAMLGGKCSWTETCACVMHIPSVTENIQSVEFGKRIEYEQVMSI